MSDICLNSSGNLKHRVCFWCKQAGLSCPHAVIPIYIIHSHFSAALFCLVYILIYLITSVVQQHLSYTVLFIPVWFVGAAEHQAAFSSSEALHLCVRLRSWCPLCHCIHSTRTRSTLGHQPVLTLQDQGERITHLRGGTTEIYSPGKNFRAAVTTKSTLSYLRKLQRR